MGKRARNLAGGMVIPVSVIESLSGVPTSQQMRDAAAELNFRAAHGEYDDLDDMQRNELLALAQMLEAWARRVAELEATAMPAAPLDQAQRAKS